MEKEKLFNRINIFNKKNLYYTLSCIFLVLIVFAIYEFYNYKKINDIKKVSVLYYQAINSIQNNEIKSKELFEEIMKKDNGFALLSAMKLSEVYINNKNYEEAYHLYIDLVNNFKLDSIYKDLIIVNASYNLINNIESNKINNLLNSTEIDNSNFRSHLYEIKFLNSINNVSNDDLKKLYQYIQNDLEIIKSVKERIYKINEFLLYK